MIGRMFGSLLLRSATYEDVEHDKSAIWQAVFIVILVSAATVVGELLAGAETDIVEAVAVGIIRGVASWAAWALCAWAVGEIAFDVVDTDADWGQLARTTGFAQIPGILNVLVFVSTVGSFIYFAAFAWTFACMVGCRSAELGLHVHKTGDCRHTACARAGISIEYHCFGTNWRD